MSRTSSLTTELDVLYKPAIQTIPSTFEAVTLLLSELRERALSTHDVSEAKAASTTLSRQRIILIIVQLSAVGFCSSASSGLITVGIAQMAKDDLGLSNQIIYWPLSVYSLSSCCCLLLAGSVADVVGKRLVNLIGCLLLGCFILACGLVKTGSDLIIIRASQGIAMAMCLPTSVGILAVSTPSGRTRNLGFASLGLSPPFGFSVGLVLGGFFIDTIGWRFGFYIADGATIILCFVGFWTLPVDIRNRNSTFQRLQDEVDWIGAAIATICLGVLGYVLAMITNQASSIKQPANIVLLVLSLALVPAFVAWVGRQEKLGKPALIPNSIWRNSVFTSICLMLLLSYAVEQTMDLFTSLFFQQVQLLSALQASLRLLPSMLISVVLNFATGLLVDRVSALHLIMVSSVICAVAPLLIALINPEWPYWYGAFIAQVLEPLSVAFLFTVGMLVISASFPEDTQALAGAVFNTVAQFGTSIGLAIIAIIANVVTQNSNIQNKNSPEALLVGYRAGFWAAFGMMVLICAIGFIGLRHVGKVGMKRD